MTGWIVTAEGQVARVSGRLPEEGASNLQALYEALGCDMVQVVGFAQGEIWCDEEGLFKPEPQLNRIASMLFGSDIVGTAYVRLRKGYALDSSGRVVLGADHG